MNLRKLNETIDKYFDFLKYSPLHFPYWKWESQKYFQDNWDIDSPRFHAMFDKCLQNAVTRKIWNRSHYEPKRVMLLFIEMNPEFVRNIFKDLFDEKKYCEGRIGRFLFHCDELLETYREQNLTSTVNTHHHHDDYQMVSWYLSFRFPLLYAPYDFKIFRKLLVVLESRELPETHDITRYFKVMRTIQVFLNKSEGIVAIHKNRMDNKLHYEEDTLLLADDFAQFAAGLI